MTHDNDEEWFAESLKHNDAWRAALKAERGINAEMIETKIMEAWDHPNIPNEDAELTKIAFQRSYLLFCNAVETGNTDLLELSMTEGELAFARSDKLHTKLVLEPSWRAGRVMEDARAKGAPVLALYNQKRKVKITQRDTAVWERYRYLTATGDRDQAEAIAMMMKESGLPRSTLYRIVKRKQDEKTAVSSGT